MLRRIILENFMSHGRTEIDLSDGLTVLTGPNNCGKSAVVAALQIVAANGKSNHVLRHGAKFCRITVETDDGHEICWERKKTVVKYTLDGEDIHRVGSSVPDSLQELLRLNKVETKAGKTEHEYDIHFGEQKSPVFLLDQPGGRAASFFASSSDASRLVEMQHLHRQNVRQRRSEAKRLNEEQQTHSKRLEHYQPIPAIADRLSQASTLLEQINVLDTKLQRLRELADSLHDRHQQSARLGQRLKTLARLDTSSTSPADLRQTQTKTARLRTTVDQLSNCLRQRHQHDSLSRHLSDLTVPPDWHDTRQINLLAGRLDSGIHRQAIATRVLDCCSTITGPPAMEPAKRCRRLLDALLTEFTRQTRLSNLNETLSPLQSVPEVHDTDGLCALISRLTTAGDRTSSVQSVQTAIISLQKPPTGNATARAKQLLADIRHRHETVEQLSSSVALLNHLTPPGDPIDPTKLTDTIDGLTTSLEATAAATKRSSTATQQAADCEMQIRHFVVVNPKCATCGADIDPDTILSHVPGLHDHSSPARTDAQRSNRSAQP